MISVIVCSRKAASNTIHERNIRKTAGAEVEYIHIDNSDNHLSLSAAYNEGLKLANGAIFVFMHEDAFFMEGNWVSVLESKFSIDTVGMVGIAGTQYLFADNPGWVVAGRPFIRGHVIHELDNGEIYNLTVFNWERPDAEVVVVDGLFFAIRRSLFNSICFDEQTFDGFHFYDLDICMKIRKTHKIIVTWDLLVKHQSGGSFNEHWKKYACRFCEKYRLELPATCVNIIPNLAHRITFENFNLKGKAPQVTIS